MILPNKAESKVFEENIVVDSENKMLDRENTVLD